jgi:calcineurin-like phosphoesterase family protein
MSNIWFTSDTHFGHQNLVRACSNWTQKDKCRDFASVEEHDAYILEQLNRRVKPQDTLYHLGDFGLGYAWRDRMKSLREMIRCQRLILLLGNHDHLIENKKNEDIRSLFTRIEYLYYGKMAGRAYVLCHYAMRTWPWQAQQSIHLYGHSHGNLPDDPHALSMDVGMDTCLFGHEKLTPYSLEEVVAIMDQHKPAKRSDDA